MSFSILYYQILQNILEVFFRIYLIDVTDSSKLTNEIRKLGVVVLRGPTIIMISPDDSYMEIANPFIQNEEEQ